MYNGKDVTPIFMNKVLYEMKLTSTYKYTLSGAVRPFIQVYVLVLHNTLARWRLYYIVLWLSVRATP